AHTARILFCGLGSDINGGGWRQYFPADAYPDRIAPTDEVLFPSLTTGILTIGLTAFALATDFDIGAAWASINGPVAHNPFATQSALQAFLKTAASVLTGVEATGLAVASGAASYAEGENASNIWSSLLALGSVIPKIIFGPNSEQFWTDVALTIIGDETGSKIANAIPYIGELIAVIEALGDAATLAEVCAETIMSPWVIENEVTLTYPATITINHDPADSTFPKTATSWRLEANVDGAVTLDPITGPINAGGEIQSDPLVVSVTAPFGGSQIQWSVVFLNSNGRQVGTGVSAQYPNNDPANPPSAVAITIKELLLPITDKTVFKRADTTGYAAAGYTWSNQITDTGTVLSKGIQQVNRHDGLDVGGRRRVGVGAGQPLLRAGGAGGAEWRDDHARRRDERGVCPASVPALRRVREPHRSGQPRAARAGPDNAGLPRAQGDAGSELRRPLVGSNFVLRHVSAAGLGRS